MNIRELDSYIELGLGNNKRLRISLLCATAFLYLTRYSVLQFARSFSLSTAIVGGSTLLLFLGCFLVYTIKRPYNIAWDGILLVVSMYLFFRLTLMFHPEYKYRFVDAVRDGRFGFRAVFTFGAGIYAYYLIRLFRDDGDKLYRLYSVIAYAIPCLEIWKLFFNSSNEYEMVFGYQMELAAILFLAGYLNERRSVLKLLLSVGCIAIGVLYGSRGCIIGYVLFFALYLFWKNKMNWKQFLLVSVVFFGAVSVNSPMIMSFIYDLFASIGLKSRTLYYLAQGNILAVDTARQDKIWPKYISKMRSMSIFKGLGVYGDRTLISTYYPYAHNFVLEILMTVGVFLGGLFLLWMLFQFIKVIRRNKDACGLMTIIFGSYALSKLFVSSTFWQETYFWAFLAMLINCSRDRNRKRSALEILQLWLKGQRGVITIHLQHKQTTN